jgi:hypothetical protein
MLTLLINLPADGSLTFLQILFDLNPALLQLLFNRIAVRHIPFQRAHVLAHRAQTTLAALQVLRNTMQIAALFLQILSCLFRCFVL